ncbi:hypothetical protein A2U01_0055822, partial [Trifolium medium]|nr:hypothetical protein [Trifolium medium]
VGENHNEELSKDKEEAKQLPKAKKWTDADNNKMMIIAEEKPDLSSADLLKEFAGKTHQLIWPKFKKAKEELETKR